MSLPFVSKQDLSNQCWTRSVEYQKLFPTRNINVSSHRLIWRHFPDWGNVSQSLTFQRIFFKSSKAELLLKGRYCQLAWQHMPCQMTMREKISKHVMIARVAIFDSKVCFTSMQWNISIKGTLCRNLSHLAL